MRKQYTQPKLTMLHLTPAEILAANDLLSGIEEGAFNEKEFEDEAWDWLGN